MTDDAPGADPVLERRARIARLVEVGQRVGYALFGVAVIAFVVGFIVGFSDGFVSVIVGCLVVGSLILAPAIVFGYGVKAADRDDREHGRPTGH
jgi:predicted cation transporter